MINHTLVAETFKIRSNTNEKTNYESYGGFDYGVSKL